MCMPPLTHLFLQEKFSLEAQMLFLLMKTLSVGSAGKAVLAEGPQAELSMIIHEDLSARKHLPCLFRVLYFFFIFNFLLISENFT